MSIVRDNLMNERGYTGYCGGGERCSMPRTFWNGHQFQCPECGWVSQYDGEFLAAYRAKWGIPEPTGPAPEVTVADSGAHYVKKPALRPYQSSAFSSAIRSKSLRMALTALAMNAVLHQWVASATNRPKHPKSAPYGPNQAPMEVGARERIKAQWKRETQGRRK